MNAAAGQPPQLERIEAVSGVVVAGHFAWRADFSLWSTHKFPTRRRAIPWEISIPNVKGYESGVRNELIMGNGRQFEARKQRLSPPAIAHNRCSARDRAVSRA
jgi:hypothetical protein